MVFIFIAMAEGNSQHTNICGLSHSEIHIDGAQGLNTYGKGRDKYAYVDKKRPLNQNLFIIRTGLQADDEVLKLNGHSIDKNFQNLKRAFTSLKKTNYWVIKRQGQFMTVKFSCPLKPMTGNF